MSENQKSYEVILLDHTEMRHDESGEYMSVFAIGGQNYKLNAKRQNLWGVFNKASKGQIFLLTFETFVNPKNETITFLSNAESGSFEAVWKAGLQTTLKRLLTAADDDRQRSQALSYAKDVAVAIITSRPELDVDYAGLFETAKNFFAFIKGQPATQETIPTINPELLSNLSDSEPIETEVEPAK